MTLEEKLLLIREEKHYSRRAAAEKLEISISELANWENGLSFPSLLQIKQICALYDVPLEYLLDHEISANQKKQLRKEKNLLSKLQHLLLKTP